MIYSNITNEKDRRTFCSSNIFKSVVCEYSIHLQRFLKSSTFLLPVKISLELPLLQEGGEVNSWGPSNFKWCFHHDIRWAGIHISLTERGPAKINSISQKRTVASTRTWCKIQLLWSHSHLLNPVAESQQHCRRMSQNLAEKNLFRKHHNPHNLELFLEMRVTCDPTWSFEFLLFVHSVSVWFSFSLSLML